MVPSLQVKKTAVMLASAGVRADTGPCAKRFPGAASLFLVNCYEVRVGLTKGKISCLQNFGDTLFMFL